MRQMTREGYTFLENEEGLRLAAYDDATGRTVKPGDPIGGVVTIGWGHTGPDVFPGQVITRTHAEALFDKDTDLAEASVEQTCPGANDNEFDAMASLCFNIGVPSFRTSSVARMWRKGDKRAAGNAFGLWRKVLRGGQLVDSDALIARRARETAMFFTPMPSEMPEPMPQAVAPPTPASASKTVIAGGLAVASGAASIADQLDQVAPILNSVSTTGVSVQSIMKLGAATLSVVALLAVGYMLWRYIQKKRRGEVVST